MIKLIDQSGNLRELSPTRLPIVRSSLYIIRSEAIKGALNLIGSLSIIIPFLLIFVRTLNIYEMIILIFLGVIFLALQMRLAVWAGDLINSEKLFNVLILTDNELYFIFLGGLWPSDTPRLITDDALVCIGRKHTTISTGELKLVLPNFCLAWSDGTLFSGEKWPSVQPEFDLKHKCWSGIDRKNKEHQRLIWRAMNPFS